MKYKLCDDTWDKNEFAAIKEVLESNMFSMGKRVEKY